MISLGVDGEVFEWGIFGGLFFEVSDVGEDVFFAFGGGEGGVVDGVFHDGYGFGREGGIGVEGGFASGGCALVDGGSGLFAGVV